METEKESNLLLNLHSQGPFVMDPMLGMLEDENKGQKIVRPAKSCIELSCLCATDRS